MPFFAFFRNYLVMFRGIQNSHLVFKFHVMLVNCEVLSLFLISVVMF